MRQLVVPVRISEAYDPRSGLQQPGTVEFQSIWDTGASASAISAKVVSTLNLKPTGMVKVQTAGGEGFVNTYLINIYLPNGVAFSGVRVSEANLVGAEDILIGMDIIAQGDFSVTNLGGKTCMSFRLPSVKRIDYVDESNRMNAAADAAARAAATSAQKEQQRKFRAQRQKKPKR